MQSNNKEVYSNVFSFLQKFRTPYLVSDMKDFSSIES